MNRPGDTRFVIKICGITSEEDAAAAVEAGATALGLNFYPKSPRYITPRRASEIIRAVPGPYWKVGVFVDAGPDELTRTAAEVPLDIVQLHGPIGSCVPPVDGGFHFRTWRAIAATDAVPENSDCEAYLLDTPAPGFGGSGKTFDWSLAIGFPHRAILAGGLDAMNVAEAIGIVRPWGVDACSRLESAPGKKDAQRVRDFVREAQAASRLVQEVSS